MKSVCIVRPNMVSENTSTAHISCPLLSLYAKKSCKRLQVLEGVFIYLPHALNLVPSSIITPSIFQFWTLLSCTNRVHQLFCSISLSKLRNQPKMEGTFCGCNSLNLGMQKVGKIVCCMRVSF